jgi:superfamily II DNA helicase RecQ
MPKDQQQAASKISRERIREKIQLYFHLQPHEEQIEAIQHLVDRRDDLILIAKTGWGKSVIFQSIPLLHPDKNICLLIMPLTLLEEDQANHINDIEGCTACFKCGHEYRSAPK